MLKYGKGEASGHILHKEIYYYPFPHRPSVFEFDVPRLHGGAGSAGA